MVEGPVTNRRFSRRQIRTAVIAASCFLLVFVVGGGGWIIYSKMTAAAEKAELESRDTMARDIAAQVNKNLSAITGQLSELVKASETVALFESGVDEELSAGASDKQQLFDKALKLRYIKPGSYDLDDVSIPPLSYASLAMLNKAETSSKINVEVHMFGTPNQHIVLIDRVVNKAYELIGLLHLSLDTVLFEDLMNSINAGDGYAELVQRASGKSLVLAKTGNAGARQGEATTVSVNDTRWIIAYWPGSGGIGSSDASAGSFSLILIIVLLLLGAAAVFFVMKRKSGSAAPDAGSLITYEGAVRAIAEGAHAGIEQLIPHLPKGDRITANLKPVSQGLNVDDATMIAMPNELTSKPAALADDDATPLSASIPTNDDTPTPSEAAANEPNIAPVIFRAYDIRGVVGDTLTEKAVYEIARAIGTRAHALGQQGIVVGRDGRNSSPELSEALIKGLRSTGRDVIDIGMVPTPVLYFATYHLETGSGVMVTGSHNAPEYNGLKIMLAGNTLSGDEIKELQSLAMSGEHASGQGDLRHADISADYVRRISEDIPVALGNALKIVVDCGNGVAGVLAPQLLNAIGHDIVEMYCDIDGNFPNHHPDPCQPENLQALIEKVKSESADVGFAFDGDGDRLGVVDGEGNIIWPDRQLMLLAKDVLSRNQGAEIIFDVKCSRYLKSIIETNGGKPLMWKTGHSFIKNKMKEVDAPLAGEMSGHIFFKERWYGFDDALYTAARFIEIFTNAKVKPAEIFAELPEGISTPELRMPLDEDEHGGFMEELAEKLSVANAEIIDIDGLRIEYNDGWGLARPSNTSPNIILRFEGESEAVVERIKSEFRAAIQLIKSDIQIPF